jgi:hypothetical protein
VRVLDTGEDQEADRLADGASLGLVEPLTPAEALTVGVSVALELSLTLELTLTLLLQDGSWEGETLFAGVPLTLPLALAPAMGLDDGESD